jgi:hypothetical protein
LSDERCSNAVILCTEAAQQEWLHAEAKEIEAIQAGVLPNDALEIVADAEAAQYVGGYIK